MQHIEFLGLPGSGKTCFYKKIIKHKSIMGFDQAIGVSIRTNILKQYNITRVKRIIKVIKYILRSKMENSMYRFSNYQIKSYPRFLYNYNNLNKYIDKIIAKMQYSADESQEIFYRFFSLCSGYQLINENFSQKEIVVFDEGFCHNSISLLLRGKGLNNEKLIFEYLDYIPLPDTVIMVNVNVINSEYRMKKRGRYPKPFLNMNKEKRISKLKELNVFFEKIVDILREKGVEVIEVDNNGSLEDVSLYYKFKNRLLL